MPFDYNKHMVGESRTVELEVEGEKFEIKVRDVPAMRMKQLVSAGLKWDTNGNTTFQLDYYYRECLKYMIVEAPWGPTTEVFLSRIDQKLSKALDSLVPTPFGETQNGSLPTPDIVKKEL